MDVEFAVPAVESAYCDLFADVVLGRRIGRRGQIDRQGQVAAAAGEDLVVGDPVGVDHVGAGELGGVVVRSTDFPFLLHHREHGF